MEPRCYIRLWHLIQTPLSRLNNILMTPKCPWFRPGRERIGWVRLFRSRRNLSLVMIGLVFKGGGRPSSKMPSWVSHKWVETVTCYSARTSSSTFTALLAPQEFSLSSTSINDFKRQRDSGNLCLIDFEKLFWWFFWNCPPERKWLWATVISRSLGRLMVDCLPPSPGVGSGAPSTRTRLWFGGTDWEELLISRSVGVKE